MIKFIFYYPFHTGSIAYPDARFGRGSGPIIYNNFRCTGSEGTILDCANNGFGMIDSCTHDNDASVTCFERKFGRYQKYSYCGIKRAS